MKILLTGTTGYIGQRLLPVLLQKGHEVICCVRDKRRFDIEKYKSNNLSVIEVNFLENETLKNIPKDIDIAYYLIHSMSSSIDEFEEMEALSAVNFKSRLQETNVKQVIYLSGIINDEKLSKHLLSRKRVEEILLGSTFNLTSLRAGIIVGSGSASFEIIRDLVEKLPVMIAPKWLNSRSQPLAVRNVIEYLTRVILREETYNKSYDIGGPEVLTYKQMLLQFAEVRGLKRTIISVPVMTPKLSSYWLYFVTSTSYKLAVNLVNSMKVEIICRNNNLNEILGIELLTYKQAVQSAFDKIAQQEVLSSWTDALANDALNKGVSQLLEIPKFGCFKDFRQKKISDENETLTRIWTIGGKKGWYYANWLWKLRGFVDKLFGGVGLRRGRKSTENITTGESLDFWRVLYANRSEKRLLLYAEMKLPGEAWLEFKIKDNVLYQTATFRPLGLLGRIYWYSVMPFHGLIFNGMLKKLAE
ncbi:MAG TPA: SDR family oxidoreductase [Draconibacterium sp.]|nr:SDR family oxidoreductase [Draconibacterium sp.]